MKKIILFSVFSAILATSCTSKKEEVVTEEPVAEVVDTHNAQNSLDYLGTYKGVLPCADCPGIETVITLNEEETYQLKRTYLEKGEGNVYDEMGSYTWKEDGNTLEFEDTDSHLTYYFVSENKLIALDQEGNKITGDLAKYYELQKQ